MPRVIVVDGAGAERMIDAPAGGTLMEALRDNGVDELLALCGGCCSCATCHVWIDPAFLERLPAPGEQENDMLESADDRRENSRLSCQLALTEALDGVRVTVVPAI